jgi:hypothetical protein
MSEVRPANHPGPATVPLYRIFLSSPGDVSDERNLARGLIKDHLPYLPAFRGRVSFEVVAWDDPAVHIPMLADETPQESVNRTRPRPATCHITVVILWSRMGTPLPGNITKSNDETYASGTEWEYEDACNSTFQPKPKVLVYRRTEDFKISVKDPEKKKKEEQFEKVEEFFKQFVKPDGSLLGVTHYDTPTAFRDLLRKDLEEIVYRELESMGGTSAPLETTPARMWTGSPYPGLRPFLTSEAAVFFGRAKETDALIGALRNTQPSFVTVVGDSGTGKSSLVYAGVLPRLAAGALDASKSCLIAASRPAYLGENPFLSLAHALLPHLPSSPLRSPAGLARELETAPGSLRDLVNIACAGDPKGGTLVLFVDQLEELFTQCLKSFHSSFVESLGAAASDARCRVIATLRADFFAAAAGIPALQPYLQRGTFPLGPLGTSVVVDIIRKPAAVAGVVLDDELVDTLLADTGGDRRALPVVAFCLDQLYRSAVDTRRLTLTDYEHVGRLRGALGKHADAVMKQVGTRYGAAATRELSSIFSLLVTVDSSGLPTRQRAKMSALAKRSTVAGLVNAMIEGRLFIESADAATVELAHEALFDCWPDLADWIDGNRADMLALNEITADAARWGRAGRDESYLLRGRGRLQLATQLRDQYSDQLENAVKEFLEASLGRARAEDAARQKLLSYEEQRMATLQAYLRPLLEPEVDGVTSQLRVLGREIENLLDTNGKWHPESAQFLRDLDARGNYSSLWEFPCCAVKVVAENEPPQFTADGCQASPLMQK